MFPFSPFSPGKPVRPINPGSPFTALDPLPGSPIKIIEFKKNNDNEPLVLQIILSKFDASHVEFQMNKI